MKKIARQGCDEGDEQMNSYRKNAVITGVLFIVATVAALAAAAVEPVLSGTGYLAKLAANASPVAGGSIFYLIAAFTSVGIAISLYPLFRASNPGMAIGFVVFRTMEAVMYTAAVVSLLSLVTVSKHVGHSGASDLASLQVMGDSLRSMREHATLAAVFAFSVGAFMYYYLFFQSRLIPRWLSGWGIAATVLMLAASLLALFSDTYVTGYALLILPIALQEMVLAVWLIVKGFNSSAIAFRSASGAMNELSRAA